LAWNEPIYIENLRLWACIIENNQNVMDWIYTA
jgi:hypothetical protein